jgi:hypothetical protein
VQGPAAVVRERRERRGRSRVWVRCIVGIWLGVKNRVWICNDVVLNDGSQDGNGVQLPWSYYMVCLQPN